jgi:hypothetical protein
VRKLFSSSTRSQPKLIPACTRNHPPTMSRYTQSLLSFASAWPYWHASGCTSVRATWLSLRKRPEIPNAGVLGGPCCGLEMSRHTRRARPLGFFQVHGSFAKRYAWMICGDFGIYESHDLDTRSGMTFLVSSRLSFRILLPVKYFSYSLTMSD